MFRVFLPAALSKTSSWVLCELDLRVCFIGSTRPGWERIFVFSGFYNFLKICLPAEPSRTRYLLNRRSLPSEKAQCWNRPSHMFVSTVKKNWFSPLFRKYKQCLTSSHCQKSTNSVFQAFWWEEDGWMEQTEETLSTSSTYRPLRGWT